MAVDYLCQHLEKSPDTITDQTTSSLVSLIASNQFDNKKQAYFLYKSAAETLIQLSKIRSHPLAGPTLFQLQNLLLSTTGRKHRAVAEALGSLPLNISGPAINMESAGAVLPISYAKLFSHLKLDADCPMHWHGRTLKFKMPGQKTGCIKFARSVDNIIEIAAEAFWLNFLRCHPPCSRSRFHIPEPVCIQDKYVFHLSALPDFIFQNPEISDRHTAIVYLTTPEYFHYPNDPAVFNNHSSLHEVFQRNARLLGKMVSKGLIHTAIIPLFHNRVQQSRRNDGGRYQWELGGRLDRWLESSRFPNFAQSGIRDFEHLVSIPNTRQLRHFIGEHLLGFILVLGSFFRNKAPEKVGLDDAGQPIDTRSLFDKKLFTDILREVFISYYQGITGFPPPHIDRFFTIALVDDLIETMGVDHDMEEALRIPDQLRMSDTEFQEFLISRGYTDCAVNTIQKGRQDIVLNTGPHLGGFNQPISVPKLVDFLFCLSSLCVSDRYIMENGLKICVN